MVAPLAGGEHLLSLGSRVMIFAIAAIALDLLVGYGALISFGHAAFIGLGAYAVGILAAHGIGDALVALPVALAVSALFAFVTGIVCLRTKGVYFIMITLAFGQMAFFTASSLAPYGGDDGLTIAARSTLAGFPLLKNERAFYYVVLLCLLAAYLLCRALVASRFGRVLRGAKENPVRMAAIGFDVFRFQLVAYVIAGMLGGLSGFLLANATEFVSPAYMSWQRSGELIIMVLLGGMGTLNGAIIGAAAFLLTEEWLSGFTEHWKVIFGPLLVLVVLFARGGLIGVATEAAEARPWLRPAAPRGPAQEFRRPGRHRRRHARRHAGRAARHHRPERRRQDDADQPDFRAARARRGQNRVRRPRHHGPAGARARSAWAWRARSRSPPSCRDSRRWRTSRSRCRRAPARASVSSAARDGAGTERSGAWTRSPKSAWPSAQTCGRGSSRTAKNARSNSPSRSPWSRSCCCSTSRWPAPAATKPRGSIAVLGRLKGRFPMVLVEHDMTAVFALADRISVLIYGRILASGAPAEVRADPRVVAAYLGDEME